jgi:hypothetical protein
VKSRRGRSSSFARFDAVVGHAEGCRSASGERTSDELAHERGVVDDENPRRDRNVPGGGLSLARPG